MKLRLPARRESFSRLLPPILFLLAGAGALLTYKITSLVAFRAFEEPHSLSAATLGEIRGHAVYAPIEGLQLAILKFTQDDALIRLASSAAALVAAVFLYLMLRKWHTTRVSLITTFMFITSTWFLQTGRTSGHDVLFLSVIPACILMFLWLVSKNVSKRLPFAAIIAGVLLYIPGAWLFLAAGGLYFRNYLKTSLATVNKKLKITSGLLFLLTIMPLLYSFTYRQRQIAEWFGINIEQDFTIGNIFQNFVDIPKYLFISGPDEPALWLSGTPVLDVFTIAMLILGLYAYYAGLYASRERIIYVSGILAVLIIGLGNVASISLLLPLIYIIVANGIAYLLQSWFTVFPRNPIARASGIVLLTIVVAIAASFHLQRYFVAWPSAVQNQTSAQRSSAD